MSHIQTWVFSLIVIVAGISNTSSAATPSQIEAAIERGISWLVAQ